jgi:CRP/FNR family transcriptional regulator
MAYANHHSMVAVLVSGSPLDALLARVHPFSRAGPAARATFAAVARRRTAQAGERFWRAGEQSLDFSFVWKGLVKIVRPRAGGRLDIIGIFGPGEAIGIVTAVRGIAYPADAVAASLSAEVIHVPRADVLDAQQRDPAFASAIAECCACRACRMRDMHAILSAGGVESRLAAFLVDLADRFGDIDDEDASVRIPVALSRSELAACTATTAETTIRVMSKWSRQGLVRSYRQGFVIASIDALRELAEPIMIRAPLK